MKKSIQKYAGSFALLLTLSEVPSMMGDGQSLLSFLYQLLLQTELDKLQAILEQVHIFG